MIKLPVFNELIVENYGLYPGTTGSPGLRAVFQPGLCLIIGANGLGKSTLISMIYRMLTGPYDIPSILNSATLGNKSTESAKISPSARKTFSFRVNDGAAKSTAYLEFNLGETKVSVKRNLSDLSLQSLQVDGIPAEELSEEHFQQSICKHARLATFGDWILVLRHLVFYFEDRRSLVWDPSAQRELLRLLFLDIDDTQTWNSKWREILERDSLVRNLGYTFRREERHVADLGKSIASSPEVRQELELVKTLQADDEARLSRLEDEVAEADAARQQARVRALAAEQDHESAVRAIEQHQLNVISAAFPSATQTAKYLVGQILAEHQCLACGSHVPGYVSTVQTRIRDSECIICGTQVAEHEHEASSVSPLLEQAVKKAETTQLHADTSLHERRAAESFYSELLNDIRMLQANISSRSVRIGELVEMLPPEEQDVHEQRRELAKLRGRLEVLSDELVDMRTQFTDFVDEVNASISQQKDAIKESFDYFAEGFLLEQCSLVWAPQRARMGESGSTVEFAAFVVDMSGSDFESPVRRHGPEQVSESQREFIDLAFRMALMSVASTSGGVLVIDAPESSLDAVFVSRASAVLTKFADEGRGNKLVLTSNLIDGDLIPQMLKRNNIVSPDDARIIDLLKIAAPTAATTLLHDEYAEVRTRIFERASDLP